MPSSVAAEAEAPLYPPAITPPKEPLSVPGYFLAFVRNPLSVLPAAAYREPIVQYTAGLTAVVDPALIRRILLDEQEIFPKTPVERNILGPLLGKGILIVNGPDWRWQRQTAAPLFRHSDILHYVPAMQAAADALIATWRTAPPGTVHLVDEGTTRATFRVISETMLASDDPTVTAALERSNTDYLLPISWPLVYAVLGLPRWLPYPRRAARKKAERDMRAAVGQLVAKRRRETQSREDLFTRLLAAKNPETGQGMSDEQMVDNLLTFLLAGHETTARALAWALYMVACSPAWERRLLAEVDRVAGDAPIEARHVDDLKETTMFLKETMRVYPPVSSMVRVAAKDVDLGGATIKKGKLIIIPIYAIHRHNLLWADPGRFDPERFTPEREVKQVRYQYMPFGAGPRICIGASFAMTEATVMLASFVRAARFEVEDGYVPVPLSRVTLQPKGGMPLKVTMRNR